MKKSKEEKTESVKTDVMTLRCSKDMVEFVESVQEYLNGERPLGVSKITKTDAILALLNYGVKTFIATHGDPREAIKK
jgi:hypothetical protein